MNKRLYIFLCVVVFLGVTFYTFYSIKDSLTAKDSDLIGNTFENKDYTMEISDEKITISAKDGFDVATKSKGVENLYLQKGLEVDYEWLIDKANTLEKVEYSIEKLETKGSFYELTLEDNVQFELIKQSYGVISDVEGQIFLKSNK